MVDAPVDFWYSALTSPLSLVCLGVILSLLVLLGLALRAAVRLGRWQGRGTSLGTDTDGLATIEFGLLLPVLLFFCLMLAQTTTLMGGNLFVHYSAFAAARSAVVQIPFDYPESAGNEYANSPSDPKYEAIFRTAVYALVPVAGRNQSGGGSVDVPSAAVVEGLSSFYSRYGSETPPWIERLIADKIAYAAANTKVLVQLARPESEDSVEYVDPPDGKFRPKDPISVRIDHKLALNIPWVNRFYAHGDFGDGIRYRDVNWRVTLTNEGILDQMPPEPRVPRRDPA